MNIKFSVELDETGIPQLIGLLAKMMDNPDPASQVVVETAQEGKTVTIQPTPAPVAVQAPAPVAPAIAPAIPTPTAPAPAAPVAEEYTVEAIGRAAAAFVDADPANMDKLLSCLQGMGVQAVTQLPDAAARAEFARRIRELGAKL